MNMQYNALIADFKRLIREPILIILMLVPFLAMIALKLAVVYGSPLLLDWLGFDLVPYYGYILSIAILLSPCMLGAVSGFMMIDDRDESMIDLMAVTPMGYSGYIRNRLVLPFIMSMLYTFVAYFVLDLYPIDFGMLLYISILTGIQSLILGLLLFSFTDNKVKGLTYAKGLDSLMVTALADLAGIGWVTALSALLPFWWITCLIMKPATALNVFLALGVHLVWLGIAFYKAKK